MKKTLTFLSVLIGLQGAAQVDQFLEHMSDDDVNFDKVEEAYQNYKVETRKRSKQYERWAYWHSKRLDAKGNLIPDAELHQRISAYQRHTASRSSVGNWEEVGPMNEGYVYTGVGRLTTIAFHPTDPNVLFVGTPSAGYWQSNDHGRTWHNPLDNEYQFGVSAILVDPNNPQIMYLGTGDKDAFETSGVGVMKSTDGGQNWTIANVGMGNTTVAKMLFMPGNSSYIIAVTHQGVYTSDNAGATWIARRNGNFRDLEFKPDDPSVVYCSDYSTGNASYIFKSIDTGKTWTRKWVLDGVLASRRYEIAVTPAAPNRLYAMSQDRYLLSENAGDTFRLVTDDSDALLEPQGWYNVAFDVDRENPDLVFSGHVQMYRSYDNGIKWERVQNTHADNHFFAWSPHNGGLYVADDGGIHYTLDKGRTWTDLTQMGVGAIYSIGQSFTDKEHILSGYQDCGSKYFDGNTWHRVGGGDGMECFFDPNHPDIFYTNYQYGGLRRFLKGLGSQQGVEMPEDDGAWVTPYWLDVNNTKHVYTGREEIWKSTNITTVEKSKDVTWTSVSSGPAKNAGGGFVKIKQTFTNPEIMYAIRSASGQNHIIRTLNLYDTTPTWEGLATYQPSNFSINDITFSLTDSAYVMAIFGSKVYESFNGGYLWNDVTENLPNVPHYCLLTDTVNGNLYLGSEAGVFVRPLGDTTWTNFSTGLSRNAKINDLEIWYDKTDHKKSVLKAASYGRGIWQSPVFGGDPLQDMNVQSYLTSEERYFSYDPEVAVTVKFSRYVDSIRMQGLDTSDFVFTNATPVKLTGGLSEYTLTVKALSEGDFSVYLPGGMAEEIGTSIVNDTSNTLSWDYVLEKPKTIGFTGPGGVGDENSILLWLRADVGVYDTAGVDANTDSALVSAWGDYYRPLRMLTQSTDSSYPVIRTNLEGFNGWPAIQFKPERRFLRIGEVAPAGRDITLFAVANSNQDAWEDSGWLGNSRTENGFVLHNNNNGQSMRSEVRTGRTSSAQYLGAPSMYVSKVEDPHIYGTAFNERLKKHYTVIDDRIDIDDLGSFVSRRADDTIHVRIGVDNWERKANGNVAEWIYFHEDIFEAKRNIVTNYLAAKYGITLFAKQKYQYDQYHYEVFGIGRETTDDYHNEAKGTGILKVSNPSAMDNGEYLLIGHDNADINAFSNSNAPAGYTRVERLWRADETGGDVGEVTIQIDAADIPSHAQKVGVMLASDKDFTQNLYGAELIDKGGYFECKVNIADGYYMTLVEGEEIALGQELAEEDWGVSLYPNPATDIITIVTKQLEDVPCTANVLNMTGSVLMTTSYESISSDMVMSVDHLPQGTYLVEITYNGQREVIPFVKQ